MFRKERRSKAQSKKMLALALIELLQTKPLSDIQITELTKHAGLSRKTFYKNFEIKEQVLSYFDQVLFIEIAKKIEDSSIDTLESFALEVFKAVLTYKKEMKILYENNVIYSSKVFDRLIDENPEVAKKVELILGPSINPFEDAFYIGGLMFVIIEWIKHDFKETPDHLAKLFTKFVEEKPND